MTKSTSSSLESIAVIGMSGRYPGAKNLEQYWDNLRSGKESISFFTEEELLEQGLDPDEINSSNYVKARGYYEGTYHFDAPFFGYSPRETELIDPQQRVLLECSWEGLENAGYDAAAFPGTIGMFGGAGPTRHLIRIADNSFVKRSFGQVAIITSNAPDYLATRVGYKLNLRGPCVDLQTACSTSLVAICIACQNLLSYQCDMALAGGVSLLLHDKEGYPYEVGGILSPDGHCRAFDAAALGTVFCQGAGVVVLKRLEDALSAHDNIHAVIRGFGLNNDGSARAGFAAPGINGQAEVSSQAIEMAGINPETISFVECHGTATPIGDPIEIAALTKSFRKHTQKKHFCAVGSVKTNIGHTDAAAGVAGFTKAVLALKNKAIPASLHFEKPNPQIDFENSPFFVNTQLLEWKPGEEPRRAGVNSFGIGGTNAHVILEEAPDPEPSGESRRFQLLLLSAKTGPALEQMTTRLATHLEQYPEQKLADVAYTLQMGRAVFPFRKMVVCGDREQAITALTTNAPGKVSTVVQQEQGRPICFLFPGQGAQHVGMGQQLYATETTFRQNVDRCAEILLKHIGHDIRELLFPAEQLRSQASEDLDQTAFTQPALFTIEYSLAELLIEWGVRPQAMLGHSLGEYVAASLSNVLSLEDALWLIATRGRLMQQLPRGSMLAVMLPHSELSKLLPTDGRLSVAAVNSSSTCTVSGPTDAIEELRRSLEETGIAVHPLRTSHAFHSAMMDPILDPFRAIVQKVRLNPPTIPYVSNLTGKWISANECTTVDYWVDHLRHTVRFADGAAELLSNPSGVLIEVGPGRTLSALIAQHPARTPDRTVVASIPHPKNDSPEKMGEMEEIEFLSTAIGRLWLDGARIHWPDFYRGEHRCRVALPNYPFQHEHYRLMVPANAASSADLDKKKPDVSDWFYYPSWKRAPMLHRGALTSNESWVLFLDSCGLGAELAESLRSHGQEVFAVAHGKKFEQTDAYSFTLIPGERNHYSALLKQLRALDKTPGNIVHLWGTVSERDRPELEMLEATLDETFFSLIFLAQAIGTHYATTPMHLYVVSNDLYNVAGNAVFAPSRATLLGPCKSIPHEYRNIACRNIDLHIPDNGERRSELIQTLLSEFTSGKDDLVAYRGGYRWLQLFYHLPAPAPSADHPGLREGGVYLITGGLGGIGLVMAEHLARTVQAKLILIGRSAFPEKTEWPEWLTGHASDDPVSMKIRKLQDLEKAGADVFVLSAEVADLERMRQIIQQAVTRFGAIHGVIHAAGVAGDGIIELKTKEMAAEVLEPKVKGTLVLDEVLKDIHLDFFMLYSSVNSVLPGAGLVDYTAANAFLDAYAYSKQKRQGATPIAVDWDRWDEVGMALVKAGIVQGSVGNRETLDHPLFSARTKGAVETYILRLSPGNSWMIGEHKIEGFYTLVGTAYLELARSAFAMTANGPIEIRDVFFMVPLIMKETESREVQVHLKPAADDFEFLIRSTLDGKTWRNHAMGKLRSAKGEPRAREHNLHSIQRCDRHVPLEFLNGKAGASVPEETFLQTGARWRNLESVSLGSDEGIPTKSGSKEAVAKLQLPVEFADDLSSFPLHPALMDRATSWAVRAMADEVKCLPFSYKKIRINKPLPQTFYSYAKLQSTDYEEFMTFDLLLVDEQGDSIVEIESFDLKRVHGHVFGDKNPASPTTQAVEAPKREKWGDCILSKEGIDVFHRILAMPPMPQIVIATKEFSHLLLERELKDAKADAEKDANAPATAAVYSRPNLATPYLAPRNELEESIAQVWGAVLGIDKVGVNDDFLDLGGHSLLAIQLAARIREMFEMELSVAKLYNARTVAGLARAIVETLTSEADPEMVEQILHEVEAAGNGSVEDVNQVGQSEKAASAAD
jgi:phthiocerol/phenolphthiocerol synthesis type-I polyketide synthase E